MMDWMKFLWKGSLFHDGHFITHDHFWLHHCSPSLSPISTGHCSALLVNIHNGHLWWPCSGGVQKSKTKQSDWQGKWCCASNHSLHVSFVGHKCLSRKSAVVTSNVVTDSSGSAMQATTFLCFLGNPIFFHVLWATWMFINPTKLKTRKWKMSTKQQVT